MTRCFDCGRPYGDQHGFPDLVIEDWAWKAIAPNHDAGGLLCPSCICARLHDNNIRSYGAFTSGPVKSITEATLRGVLASERLRLLEEGK